MRKLMCFSLIVLGLTTASWASHIAEVEILSSGDIMIGDEVPVMVTACVPGQVVNVQVCQKVILNTVQVNIYVDLACGPAQPLQLPVLISPQYGGLNMVSVNVYYRYTQCCGCCFCPCRMTCVPTIWAIGMSTFMVSQPCICLPWWWYCTPTQTS